MRALPREVSLFLLAVLALAVLVGSWVTSAIAVFTCVAVGATHVYAQRAPAKIAAARELSGETFEVGDVVRVRTDVASALPRRERWVGVFDLSDPDLRDGDAPVALLDVPADRAAVLREEIRLARRGYHRIGPSLIHTTDPMGLEERWEIADDAHYVTVYADVEDLSAPMSQRGAVHALPTRRSLLRDPTRPRGVRDYRRGDPLKHVHWRATARVGRLQTRIFEPVALSGITIALEMSELAYTTEDVERERSTEVALEAQAPEKRSVFERFTGRRAHPIAGAAAPKRRAVTLRDELELAVTVAASLSEYTLGDGLRVGLVCNGLDATQTRRPPEPDAFATRGDALRAASDRLQVAGVSDVMVDPARGALQRERLRTVYAHLSASPRAPLDQWLIERHGDVARDLVLAIVTPSLHAGWSRTIALLRHQGIDVVIFWVAARKRRTAFIDELGLDVPVYLVPNRDALRSLRGIRL